MSFEERIDQWVSIDNQIKILNDKIKMLRDKKLYLNTQIMNYVSENKLNNSVIPINDGKIKFTNTKISEPLTFKYLEKSLGNIIKNENQVKQIMEYIKTKREIKIISEIKRISNI